MNPIASRVPEDVDAGIEGYADENDVNKSDAIRELLSRGLEYEDLRSENERLRNEKRTLINQREEHGELVEYVEGEREIQQRREERRDAPVWRRAKWWVFGRGGEDTDG